VNFAPVALRAREVLHRGSTAWFTFPVVLFLGSRIALVGLSHFSLRLVPALSYPRPPGMSLPVGSWVEGFCRWDCGWYIQIARLGFHDVQTANFWPIFPAVGGLLHRATGLAPDVSLLLLANLACLGAFLLLFRIFEELGSRETAQGALTLFAAFPGAFFLSAGLTEPFMVFFSALGVWLALRSRHLSAGVAVGLAGLSRVVGFVALASLAVAQLRERPSLRRFLLSPWILALAVPPLFLAGYMLFLDQRFGRPFQFLESRQFWGKLASFSVVDSWNTGPDTLQSSYLVLSLVPLVGGLLLLTRRQWWVLAPFALVLAVLNYATGMSSLIRYAAVIWPAFLPLATGLQRYPALTSSLIAAGWLFQAIYLYLFVHHFPVL